MLKHGINDGVATITIANPPVNVLTVAMLREWRPRSVVVARQSNPGGLGGRRL